jgi:PAS domain S-box-containing protein
MEIFKILFSNKTDLIKDLFEGNHNLPLFISDREGNFLYGNRTLRNLLDLSKEEIKGKNIKHFYAGTNLHKINEFLEKIKEGKDLPNLEIKIREANDEIRYYEISPIPLKTNKEISSFLGLAWDITDWKKIEDELKSKMAIEKCMAKISKRFIGHKDLDDAINSSLKEIGKLQDADRAYLFLFSDDKKVMKISYRWCAKGISSQKGILKDFPLEKFPWWISNLRKQKMIQIEHISDLPKEAHAEKKVLESYNIKSVFIVPIYCKGILSGFVGFDNISEREEWNDEDILLFQIIGTIFGKVIEEKRREQSLKRTLTQLREAKEKYRRITNLTGDIIVKVNKKGEFTFLNDTACKFLGKSRENLIGTHHSNYLDFKDIKKTKKTITKLNQTKKPIKRLITQIKTAEGWKTVEWNGLPVFDKKENFIGIQATGRDISKRKKMESQFKFITENISDMISVLDQNLNLIYMNGAVEEISGFSIDEIKGLNPFQFMHPNDVKHVAKAYKKALSKGTGSSIYRLKCKDGTYKWIEARAKVSKSKDKKRRIIVVSRDITERKRAEQKLKEMLNKTKFYKDLVSHDMANILSNIKNSVKLLDIFKDDSKKFEEMKYIIIEQAEKGVSLISNVRKQSKTEKENLKISSIDIMNRINNAIKNLRTQFQTKKIIVHTNFPKKALKVNAGNLLLDACENILLNGCLHNENNPIELWIKLSVGKWNGQEIVQILFEDNGIGIEETRRKEIFKPNPNRDREKGGMGIGLSLVKKIIEKYGGKIFVENRIEGDYTKGTKFIVFLNKYRYR